MSFWYRNGVCSNNGQSYRLKYTYARRVTGGLAVLCTFGVMVRAQDVPPGLVARFDVEQRLEYSDNPDFEENGSSDFLGRTILGFGLESQRKVDSFALDLGVDITEGRSGDSSIDTENPFISLTYDRNTRNAAAGVDFAYRESDVDSDINEDDFNFDSDIINQDSGTRQSTSFSINAALGREAPIGGSFDWRYNELTYSDTTDPSLTDQNSSDFTGQIDFRISPRISLNLRAIYFDFDAEGNGVNRKTTGLGAGADLEISSVLTADVGFSYDRIERSGDETDTDQGLSLNLGVTRAVPNGTWGARFTSDVNSNDDGRRSTLSVNRRMELLRGNLSYSLGLTGADLVGTDPLIDIDYTHILRTAELSFGVGQQVATNDDNDERINTNLRASFDHEINNTSSYGVSVAFFDVNDLSAASDDSRRLDLSLTYRYNLTRDWGLVGSFTHARLSEDNAANRSRNTVFIGLQRSFSWNP